ncbi:MAG TPA: ribonuclease H family protein [Saprospiraceae bacterium]|nr:ribonuclease H family protein [Saprospiraceae bacterium]
MASKKQKYYVVWHGHNPGIYTSWEKCLPQVKNFPNAIYKSFNSRIEAEEAFGSGSEIKKINFKKNKTSTSSGDNSKVVVPSISVDAACSGNPGLMEYRGVLTSDKTEIFHFGPVKNGTNNIGEFLAIVHALALLQKQKDQKTPIYSDSRTAMSWVKHKKAKTLLKKDRSNSDLFDMIHRAEVWLKNNEWKNPLLKWETSDWGENPADFGRK